MGIVFLLILVALYMMPTGIAAARHHNPGGVAIVNVLLGWTMIGWIIALVMASGAEKQPVLITQHTAMLPRFDPQTGRAIRYDQHTGQPLLDPPPGREQPTA